MLAKIAIIVILLTLLIVGIKLRKRLSESFATRADKAAAIYKWFSENKDYSYAKYKSAMRGQSNIVEYEDILRQTYAGKLTYDIVYDLVNKN